jgi:hypothetical protein
MEANMEANQDDQWGVLWDRYSSEATMKLWDPEFRADFIARGLRGELTKDEYEWVLAAERLDRRLRELGEKRLDQ